MCFYNRHPVLNPLRLNSLHHSSQPSRRQRPIAFAAEGLRLASYLASTAESGFVRQFSKCTLIRPCVPGCCRQRKADPARVRRCSCDRWCRSAHRTRRVRRDPGFHRAAANQPCYKLSPAWINPTPVRFKPAPHCRPACAAGYVFQDAHLLPWHNALNNVALPLELLKPRTRAHGRGHASPRLGRDYRREHALPSPTFGRHADARFARPRPGHKAQTTAAG